jgi:hypothetical protein
MLSNLGHEISVARYINSIEMYSEVKDVDQVQVIAKLPFTKVAILN